MAGAQTTFGGERMGQEEAPTEGSALPSRPARAGANDAASWRPPVPIVPADAADGAVDHRVERREYCGE